MPNVVDIIQSVQIPQLIKDPFINKGKPLLDDRDRPIHYSGGFAVAIPFEVNGDKWAFRCWSADIGDVEGRLKILSKELSSQKLPYFCDFTYVAEGITVNGDTYPTTRMRWIEGQTIKDYICTNKDRPKILKQLADIFFKMCRELHKSHIAHGDLQHGNILVDNSGSIFLIDYDSVYLPALNGADDIISGLADYQHPMRKDNKEASEKLDYFSELIIYVSILAIAEDPTLVDKYQVSDAERMLFSKDDFVDITNSQIYKDIQALGGKFQDLLDVLEGYLKETDIDALRPFNEQIIENKITFKASATKAIRSKQSVRVFWQVPFEADVTLQRKGTSDNEKGNQGSINVILDEDAEFELTVNIKDGTQITRTTKIYVFDECKIDFSADKQYVFPSLPVALTWNVTNANKVWLGSEEVDPCGSKIVELTSDTVYILQAKDEFGMKNERLTVKTIPIKQAKILLASPPNFTIKQSFSVTRPKYNVEVKFPQIDIDWIKVEVPKVKSFKELGLNVELSPPLPKPNFNLMSSIRTIFKHIIRK